MVNSTQREQPQQPFGITSPRDGSVFALDPDMPLAVQRITFEGEPGTWLVNGRRVGQGAVVRWLPAPGRHQVSLVDGSGRVLQQVKVEVRSLRLVSGRSAALVTPKP